ncbi:MAG: bifunctional phosphoglucose/phosphomannose isomerase [Calditrichaeota bacterium]|nr:bifunctional phosphoglucose/phosphomannose isomerase [Calditrichota bacterium]
MYTVDKTGYKNILLNFHTQIFESKTIFEKSQISVEKAQIKNILYLGIGASGLAGDLLDDVLFDELEIPMNIVRSYFTPGFCNQNTLVIASSYSGDTEETISATKAALENGAQIVCVTSGGELLKLAAEHNLSVIKLPENYRSRQALGYLFFTVYHLFGNIGLLRNYDAELKGLIRFAKEIAHRNDYPKFNGHILSRELANTLQNKVPVIYSTEPYLRSVSLSWKKEIQQKAKALAFANVIPEMNHNEIVAWEWDSSILKNFIVIFLENKDVHPRILKRIELTKRIIKKRGVQVVDIYADGQTVMEKVFSLILLGDWVSYYLALLYKKDPVEIEHVDFLKREMAAL